MPTIPLQESTKHSPFEAMFGRVARLPVNCNTDNIDTDQKLQAYTNLRSSDSDKRDAKRCKIEKAVKETLNRRNRSKNIL